MNEFNQKQRNHLDTVLINRHFSEGQSCQLIDCNGQINCNCQGSKTEIPMGVRDTIHFCTEHKIFVQINNYKINIYSFSFSIQYTIDIPCSKSLTPCEKFWILALMTAINVSVAICQLTTCKFSSFGKKSQVSLCFHCRGTFSGQELRLQIHRSFSCHRPQGGRLTGGNTETNSPDKGKKRISC